jgi:pantoate--beta-alanine ligase
MIARTLPALSRAVDGFRAMKATVALIPTRAHSVSAMRDWRFAKRRTNKLNVSIFVKPTQFAPREDIDSYPRTWKSALAKLAAGGFATKIVPRVQRRQA